LYSMSPSFLNLFMKKFAARARRTDHVRERLLRDLRQGSLGIDLAVARQQQQRPTVSLVNGANACAVQWQVSSSATIDVGTTFVGNILALTAITMNGGASRPAEPWRGMLR